MSKTKSKNFVLSHNNLRRRKPRPYAGVVAEVKLTIALRDAAQHETVDAETGKLKLHPYLRNRLRKAEKIAARRDK